MRVSSPYEALKLPDALKWVEPAVCYFMSGWRCAEYLPWVYVTVRHGIPQDLGDDVWHVDGYSMRIPHPPEVDFIWASSHPTEFLLGDFVPPADFNPLRHDLALWLQGQTGRVVEGDPRVWYEVSPYVVHRRPPSAIYPRTFVRISLLPIEIVDDVQAQNPHLEDRRRPNGFRRTLVRYMPVA